MYIEMTMKSLEHFRIGGRVINNLRYADDTVILAETGHELQDLMDIVVQDSEQKGLFLNRAKAYTMVFSKSSSIPTCQIKVHGKLLEQVNSFVYLRSVFTSDARCEKEVERRIDDGIHIYEESIAPRKHQYGGSTERLKCYVWSTLLHGCETWTLSQGMMKTWRQQNTGF